MIKKKGAKLLMVILMISGVIFRKATSNVPKLVHLFDFLNKEICGFTNSIFEPFRCLHGNPKGATCGYHKNFLRSEFMMSINRLARAGGDSQIPGYLKGMQIRH